MEGVRQGVLQKLAAMRAYMRDVSRGRDGNPSIPESVGMSEELLCARYRLMAVETFNALKQRHTSDTQQ